VGDPAGRQRGFVANMEDVLEVYQRSHDPQRPLEWRRLCSMVFAPLEGWRHVNVTDRHTPIDYAHTLRDLSDVPR
jgi:hypothetical protein